jgi:uncharacterized Zn finger protein (UPF0148 family)
MEKLGVDERVDQEQREKVANAGCPKCGGPLEKHGSVLQCPKHGTEPFEKESCQQRKRP